MQGYLLDTNVVAAWFNGTHQHHGQVRQRIEAKPAETPMMVSAITLGEIEHGHRVVTPEDTSLQATFREFVYDQLPHPLPVRETTGMYYGQLRARLFEKFAPKDKRTKGLRPEQLTEPVTSLELGIQENDLWIAAQASEYNLVLATNDKMLRIREVASGLVQIESWIAS